MSHPHSLTAEQAKAIEVVLLKSHFSGWDPSYMSSPDGRRDINEIVSRRYDECLSVFVPWIQRRVGLDKKRVVEVGCGAGSGTSAFAWYAETIDAYDIDAKAIEGATGRAQILGQENIAFHLVTADGLLTRLRSRHQAGSLDIAILYAVLEHQRPLDRLETLSLCWELLKPGGALIVLETPNRLAYFDGHTSLLPFFSALPPEIAIRYASYSPREVFARSIADARVAGEIAAQDLLATWGRGVSYHEFQLGLGPDLDALLIADGFDPEILGIRPIRLAERCLYTYWVDAKVPAPSAFARVDLDLIFRKPGATGPTAPRAIPPIQPLVEPEPSLDRSTLIRRLLAAIK